jgi:putative oxidoreductase
MTPSRLTPTESAPQPRPWLQRLPASLAALPWADDVLALLARVSIAGVFWRSGQTKVEGFAIDLVEGRFELGWPRLAEQTVDLFRDEYRLPLLAPELAAVLATWAEHLLPLALLLGLATRLSAFGLLGMTAAIQLLVYPAAWPTHGVWAAVLLMLVLRGPGAWSLDRGVAHVLAGRRI